MMGPSDDPASAPPPRQASEGGSRPPAGGQERRGQAPWPLALLLVVCLIVLFSGLILFSSGSARPPALRVVAEASATPTLRPRPTSTRPPPVSIVPQATATHTALPPGLRFTLDPASIDYVPGRGRCDWSGVAGRVVRRNGSGAAGLLVVADKVDSDLEVSGTTDSRGNFELRLGDVPLLAPWSLQVRSQGGSPLSEFMQIVTSEQCDQNLIVLEFSEQG
ncbi:MAG: carboxypeptidase-like regulatory domain-containing protein [Anaerolineaceae bacterium]|nr:carboxypeptidase-like regulatory domain-containing protein [Anaerolineaceae bacterium]